MKSKKEIYNLHEPNFSGNEKKYVNDCIKSTYVSPFGKYLILFEKKIKNFTNSKNIVLTNSGTSALHLAINALNILPKEEIIVPTITFIAPINVVRYNKSIPIFMDCDEYFNIDVNKTIDFIKNNTVFKNNKTINKKTGRKISAIIIVHVFGNAVFLDNLIKLCKKRKIFIIEDATEALGTFYKTGKYKGRHAGTVADIGCLSFNGNKIITTGSGGAILTNNKKLSSKCLYLSTQAKDDSIFFKHNNIGYNYRMTNLNASIGLGQIENLKKIVKKKIQISKNYMNLFIKSKSFHVLNNPKHSLSNNWLNIIIITNPKIRINNLIKKLIKNNINARPVWYPNHMQKPFKVYETYKINNAKNLIKTAICLPSSSFLNKSDLNKIYNIIHS